VATPETPRLDSPLVQTTGFTPSYDIDDAIWEIAAEFRMGRLRDEERFYNTSALHDLPHAA
jgi:hypothetical protein